MLSEKLSFAEFIVLFLCSLTTLTILVLGVLVICRARRRDLPKIVKGIGGWFRTYRR